MTATLEDELLTTALMRILIDPGTHRVVLFGRFNGCRPPLAPCDLSAQGGSHAHLSLCSQCVWRETNRRPPENSDIQTYHSRDSPVSDLGRARAVLQRVMLLFPWKMGLRAGRIVVQVDEATCDAVERLDCRLHDLSAKSNAAGQSVLKSPSD